MSKLIKVSVRNLVEFIMRHGSIDNRYVSSVKAIEGTKAHQKIQKSYKKNYNAEVPLKYTFNYKDIHISVEGRADGILIEEENIIIDEIKTTTRDLLDIDENFNLLHWAQAKCYGYIYAKDNDLKNIEIQLTYYNIETFDIKYLRKKFTFKELEEFFFSLIEEYRYWAKLEGLWIDDRNKSIKGLTFPFENYRSGQRELAVRVYKSITDGKKCLAQAPTGIGKTISTLFPAIKAMGESHTSKIFYLTAKAITREVGEKSIKLMKEKNLKLKYTTITAKEKVCKMEEVNCNPEYCKYAKGYYDRINDALKEILGKYNDYNRHIIQELSEKYELCPFELSLDLTLWSDVIICDYNYVFDPKVYLKRFFDGKKTDYTFLIDEAHNLVDRGREMYSATLNKDKVLSVKRILSKKDKKVSNSLNKINSFFIEKRKHLEETEETYILEDNEPLDLYSLLRIFIERTEEYLANSKEENKDLLELYFDVYSFLGIGEFYNENYITLTSYNGKDVNIKLYCVNPSKVLQERMDKGKSTIIFSATLLPMNYFKDIYGATKEDYFINLRSPFSKENRLLLVVDNISTTYSKRESTSEKIVRCILECVNARKGNYMVFFPSYKYMELIYKKIKDKYFHININMQTNNMDEEEKEKFLSKFHEKKEESEIGFCVLGGHFAEGIDLIHDKLIGVIIIGVGMPQIGLERDIIKDHFNKKEGNKGFDYAYTFPGMIKVLQGGGRCIRTEKDKGIIMLIDSRYSRENYRRLFPPEWFPNIIIKNINNINKLCKEFWDKNNN